MWAFRARVLPSIVHTLSRRRREPSEAKAMGPCLDAARKLAVVERTAGRSANLQPSAEEVIERLRSDAFASPGSPRQRQFVFVIPRVKTSPHQISNATLA